MSGSHFDVSHSISLHPYPLLHVTHQSDHVSSPPSQSPSPGHASPQRKAGSSTAVEPVTPPDEPGDPMFRRSASTAAVSDYLDVERQRAPRFDGASDPLKLSTKIKSDNEINSIRTTISRRNSIVGQLHLTKDASKAHKVHNFYKEQNERIYRLLKPVDEHRREAKELNDSSALQYKIAVNASFAANICLAIIQTYAAIASGSLSLFTTMADALFDPCSNITLILCNRAVNRVNPRKFPQGKARIETAGNIAFCFLMCAVSFILIALSARELADGSPTLTSDFHLPSIIGVAVSFCTKLALFFYCFSLRNRYSQIHILWEDHRNDLLINGVGLATSVMGSKIRWWIDPAGAIVLSILIAALWLRTAWSEFQLLIGVSADIPMLQHLTYISMTHSPDVKAIDTVRAWHSGPRLIVEVDIVMGAEQTLRETHDVAEDLQTKLESLPGVDRAYVHVDYETSHAPEHFLKKEL